MTKYSNDEMMALARVAGMGYPEGQEKQQAMNRKWLALQKENDEPEKKDKPKKKDGQMKVYYFTVKGEYYNFGKEPTDWNEPLIDLIKKYKVKVIDKSSYPDSIVLTGIGDELNKLEIYVREIYEYKDVTDPSYYTEKGKKLLKKLQQELINK